MPAAGDSIDATTLDRLQKMVGGKVLREITELFFEHTPGRVAAVRAARDADDLPGAAQALHNLKSSAGMLGAKRLQQLAERMEQLARSGGDDESPWPLVEQLEREYEQAAAALRRVGEDAP